MQLVHLLDLVDPLLVGDLAVVLEAVGPAEEDQRVLPLIADPTLAALHACPFGTRVHLEVSVLGVMLIEDELGVAQFSSDDQWLDS